MTLNETPCRDCHHGIPTVSVRDDCCTVTKRSLKLALFVAVLTWLSGGHPASAQSTSNTIELQCSGSATLDVWGAGTSFPANRRPPRTGSTQTFNERFKIDLDRSTFSKWNGSYYSDETASLQADGWNMTRNELERGRVAIRATISDRWNHSVVSYSIRAADDGSYSYNYYIRDEDRNRLIFELYRSDGTCRTVN
jgi:hypothetical protein